MKFVLHSRLSFPFSIDENLCSGSGSVVVGETFGSSILRERIDRMVNLFGRTHPDFVAGYDSARVIVDQAASHAAPKAHVSTPPAGA